MATIYRFQVDLTGFTGAPGVNTWFIGVDPAGGELTEATANGAAALFRQFYLDARGVLQTDVTANINPEVTGIDDVTGETVSVQTITTVPNSVTGQGAGSGSHATMLKLRLLTGVFEDGRQIRGGPYLGPISSSAITGGGAIDATDRSEVVAAGVVLAQVLEAQGTRLRVWRRPREAAGGLPARDGRSEVVTAFSCGTVPAVLRSRRD